MSVDLKPHNQEAYNKVKEAFETSNKTAVIHPTGTGKSYIAMKLIEENQGKKAIYLAPSVGIFTQLKTPKGQTIKMTYQTLARLDDEEIKKLGVDIIVLDEFHHCGAPVWGEAVQKLIKANPNAKVLGLSATPIRYFDGNVDMAEELFGENIASEMSFEEAVEQGILPEFDYVSALYGVEESLEKLKEKIEQENSIAPSKKDEAYRLYNQLKARLEKNAQNLPQVFKEHIKNPNGKYIVFCRSYEDMQSKIAEVQKLFEQVNTNIDIYSVSSYDTSQKNQRLLSEFTDNHNPNSLKLMFAINMLNEGIHLPDIDGVIMMRPTMSPTIYQQQMGRALSCGNEGKRTSIIDLVDNFNTIRVIEDFNDRMKGIEPTGNGREITENERKIRIYDYLEDTNQIIDKIQKLSRRRSLTIEEKVDLFEKYLNDENTEDTIISDNIYEGYPIGTYLMSIRVELNDEEKAKRYSKEIVEKLENLGLLDDRHESTIDEKIDRLIEFVQNYPQLWKFNSRDDINKIVSDYLEQTGEIDKKEELTRLLEIANKDYAYIRTRKSRGKITQEDIERLADAGVGGVFGISPKAELKKQEFLKEFDIDSEIYDLIIKNYGTMENFKKIYLEALINDTLQDSIDKKILETCNFVKNFDLSKPDLLCRENEGYIDLVRDIFGLNILVIDGNMNEIINDIYSILEKLTKKHAETLENLYGLNGHTKKTKKEVAEQKGITRSAIDGRKKKALEALMRKKIFAERNNKNFLKILNKEIENDKYLRGFLERYFKEYGIFVRKEEKELDNQIIEELRDEIIKEIELSKEKEENVELLRNKIPQEKLQELYKGITGLELEYIYREQLMEIVDNELVQTEIRKINVKDVVEKYKVFANTNIENLELSANILRCLEELEIKSLSDIINSNYNQAHIFSYLEKGEFEELIASIQHELIELEGKEKEKIVSIINNSKDFNDEEKEELMQSFASISQKKFENINILPQTIITKVLDRLGYSSSEEDLKKMEKFLNSNKYFSEQEKNELLRILSEKYDMINAMYIEELDLSVRAFNGVKRSGINTVKELAGKTEKELKKIAKLGPKCIEEIKNKLHSLGIKLKDEEELEEASVNDNSDSSLGELIDDTSKTNSVIESEDNLDEQIKPTKEQKAMQLENIIQKLKQAYITLGQRDKEFQVAIQERVEELERVRNEKITTEEKLHKLEKIVEENRQFFEELGELESFEQKIQNTLKELEGKRREEKGIEETIENLRKQQAEVQNQKEDIQKQIHDISQEL